MRKSDFCLCENKGADQLCSNCTADQHLCFRYMDSSIILNFRLLAIFYICTGRFVSDIVGTPKDQFSCVMAHMMLQPRVLYVIGIIDQPFNFQRKFTNNENTTE